MSWNPFVEGSIDTGVVPEYGSLLFMYVQLSVAVTAALTLIAYHIALAGKLPDIPYLTRMDKFLFGSTLLVFTALLEVVFTSRLAGAGRLRLARSMDRVCAILFPLTFIAIAAYALGLPDMISGLKA